MRAERLLPLITIVSDVVVQSSTRVEYSNANNLRRKRRVSEPEDLLESKSTVTTKFLTKDEVGRKLNLQWETKGTIAKENSHGFATEGNVVNEENIVTRENEMNTKEEESLIWVRSGGEEKEGQKQESNWDQLQEAEERARQKVKKYRKKRRGKKRNNGGKHRGKKRGKRNINKKNNHNKKKKVAKKKFVMDNNHNKTHVDLPLRDEGPPEPRSFNVVKKSTAPGTTKGKAVSEAHIDSPREIFSRTSQITGAGDRDSALIPKMLEDNFAAYDAFSLPKQPPVPVPTPASSDYDSESP